VVPPKVVFQRKSVRISGVAIVATFGVAGAFIVAGALDASIGQRVSCAIGEIALVYLFPSLWRQLRSPKPTVRIDHEGLEGTFGLVRWADVDRAVISHRYGRRPSIVRTLSLELKNGAPPPRQPSAEYALASITGKPLIERTAIVLPLWSSRRSVAEDLQQYAPGLLD
jgi:hypothetical protein